MVDPNEERRKRVHVAGARAARDGFVVVISDPAIDAAGREVRNPDTWEVSWDAWIAAGARIERL